ncbi:hypothetical protein E3N88_00478 [Mikania micrantha]|uniref:MADS-box domain-containing protein n=1 Tax=Mikania micrantha TaxID=192012 RepID=A0A5N6PYJ8_9ASTR|nr:hypothetical protein E3N88_00478 [Mikania micrantha]
MMPKKSKGRQKIQMARMEKESNLLVTFSKRRSGLFKKASELCILCGLDIAIIAFSPESLGLEELERLMMAMGWLKKNIDEQMKRIVVANTLPIVPVPVPGPGPGPGPSGIGGEYIVKSSGLEITMTPHGFVLGYGHFNR